MFIEIDRFVNWIRRRNPQAETHKTYRYHLNRFVSTALEPRGRASCSPRDVTLHDVDHFIEALAHQGLKGATINRCLTTLASFYRFLSDEDPTILCPVLYHRHKLRDHQRLPRAVPSPEVDKLFTVIHDARDRAIFLLMLRCGLRVSEVCKIRLGDLFLDERPPRLRVRGKNSKERAVYLSAATMAALDAVLVERPTVMTDLLFLTYAGDGIGVRGVQKRLQRYCHTAGVTLTAHQLRHNFANNLVLADVPVTTIQKLLGHAWVGTTQNYVAANDGKVKADFVAAMTALGVWHE